MESCSGAQIADAAQDSLKDILTSAVGGLTADLTAYQTFMTETYASRLSDAEADDESGGFSPIDGWCVRLAF